MIDPSLSADLRAFQVSFLALRPLADASPFAIGDLLVTGNALLGRIEDAIDATGAALDVSEPAVPPSSLADAVRNLVAAGADQSSLHDMRGFLGRAVLNLTQASV